MLALEFANLPDTVGQHHVARTVVRGGQRTFAHTHDFSEIFLVERGQGVHVSNGASTALGAGSLVFVAPQDEHYFACDAGESLAFINLALAPGWLPKFCAMMSPPAAMPEATHIKLSAAEYETCERALRELLADGGADPTLTPALMALVLRLACRAAKRLESPATEPPEWLARWRAELFSYRGIGQPIRYWQQQACVSAEHLARSCRRFYGDSPTSLILRARLEWVCDQLRRGDMGGIGVTDLAYDAGFDSLSYFYRSFRAAYGCTPLDWLARRRAGPVPF